MKYLKIVLFSLVIILLFLPTLIAEDTIKIKSIEVEELSTNAVEKSSPKYEGLNLDFDLEFRDINNYAKYKIIIENNTDKDYFIQNDTYFNESNNFKYNYYSEGNIKANDTSVVYLVISYDNKVNESLFVDNIYVEKNSAVLTLLNEDGQAAINPDTGIGLTFANVLLVLIISVVLLLIFNESKVSTLGIFLISFIVLPNMIFASEKLQIKINVTNSVSTLEFYSIDYIIDPSNILIKDEEINNYILDGVDCVDIYIDEKIEKNKYKYCQVNEFSSNIIYRNPKKYFSGENVLIDDLLSIYVSKEDIDFDTNCSVINGDTICNDIVVVEERLLNYYDYVKAACDFFGYTYNEEIDFKCNNAECSVITGEAIILEFPIKFTMPNHDLLFIGYVEGVI